MGWWRRGSGSGRAVVREGMLATGKRKRDYCEALNEHLVS